MPFLVDRLHLRESPQWVVLVDVVKILRGSWLVIQNMKICVNEVSNADGGREAAKNT